MRCRRRPLGRSPSLVKVVKRKGKLVVGRVEGDPRCLEDFCPLPVWWNRLKDKLRDPAVCHPSHTSPPRDSSYVKSHPKNPTNSE